jgi:hypothetical protein
MDIFDTVMRDTEGRETSGMDDEDAVATDIPNQVAQRHFVL